MNELRTISRIYELFHIPQQHSADVLRGIYAEISGTCDFDNFIRIPGGARLESASAEGGAISSVTFLKDRITFRDENTGSGLETFLRRIEASLTVAAERLTIPLYVARNITYRAMLGVQGYPHSSQFLAAHIFNLSEEQFAGFDRPGHLVGFRLQFPPKDPLRDPLHQVRIETYLRDPRALYLEDWATFKVPVQGRDWARLASEGREVEIFLSERIGNDFLGQFKE